MSGAAAYDLWPLILVLLVGAWPILAIPGTIWTTMNAGSPTAQQEDPRAIVKMVLLGCALLIPALLWLVSIFLLTLDLVVLFRCEGAECAQIGTGSMLGLFLLWSSYLFVLFVRRSARPRAQAQGSGGSHAERNS